MNIVIVAFLIVQNQLAYFCGSISGSSALFHWSVCLTLCHCLCLYFNWIVFLFLSFESSFYVLHTNPLLNKLFANIFSHSVACLFIVLIVCSHRTIVLNFDDLQGIIFFLLWIMLLVSFVRTLHLNPGHG